TEFPVQGKKLYLSSVLDLFNREVIAYSLSERPVMEMVNTMLEMVNTMLDGAFPKLRPGDAPLLHSDQGWHYRMRSYQERLKA
ncbi:DDE-type integrase/transposase/recombinase, partial [Klebsiella pneumoniae]